MSAPPADRPPEGNAAPPAPDDALLFQLNTLAAPEAARLLAAQPDAVAVRLLAEVSSSVARAVIARLDEPRRDRLIAAAPAALRAQWALNATYPPGTLGRLMQPPAGVVPACASVQEAIARLRIEHAAAPITYLYAVDPEQRLVGVVVLRDLFLARPEQRLAEIMIPSPFSLRPETTVLDAMKQVVTRHFPVYPVCDDQGRLLGLVRGHVLFEKQAYVISAQSGKLVGVRMQEHLSTHWARSLAARHPWLLFNLVVSLASAAVVTLFQDAIRELVILAIFLSVVSSQARNSGAQTMAVTLRGLTTGEWAEGAGPRTLAKESLLGLVNGLLVGLIGGIYIYVQAWYQGLHRPEALAAVLVASMGLGCMASAAIGVAVPLGLRRLGADPALAAGIIFTALATVLSQAVFLGLAVWWVL